MRQEKVTISFLSIPLIFLYSVFEASGSKGNNWGATNEKLMLDNTTWFKYAGHKSEIRPKVDNWPICKEFIRSSPETIRESL
jgi:hypothetical protein